EGTVAILRSNFATANTVPAAPGGLNVASGSDRLTLTWADNSNNETGFAIERSSDGRTFVPIGVVGPNVTTFVNYLSSGTFSYRVKAFNLVGESDYSNVASGSVGGSTPGPLTVTGTGGGDIIYLEVVGGDLRVTVNDVPTLYPLSSFTSLTVNAGGGD